MRVSSRVAAVAVALLFLVSLVAAPAGEGQLNAERLEGPQDISASSEGFVPQGPAQAEEVPAQAISGTLQQAAFSPRPPASMTAEAEGINALVDGEQAVVETETPDEAEGLPTAAAVPPPSPQDFSVSYDFSRGQVSAKWSPVSAPDLKNYVVHRWTQDDFSDFLAILLALRQFDPSATGYLQSLQLKVDKLLNSPGLTFTERQAMLDDIETDLDALLAILCSNLDAQPLLSQAKNLADRYTVRGTTWSGSTSSNSYYWYAVLARNRSGQESPFSHCEVIFSARDDGRSPAAPKGFSAVGYDPGVDLSWSRNTETDLAGYNLYRQQSGSWVKLNSSLVTVGTEFFFEGGASGEQYAVTAVDLAGRESARSTATASLAPATRYGADDPGWSTVGFWKLEKYAVGGELVPLLVANDAGANASHTFTGRRLKLMVSTYHTCGQVRILVDGNPMGTFDLYSPSVCWGVNVFTVTGLAKGSHTFTLEALGIGGSQEPGGFHFVDVQYIEVR